MWWEGSLCSSHRDGLVFPRLWLPRSPFLRPSSPWLQELFSLLSSELRESLNKIQADSKKGGIEGKAGLETL